MATFDDLTKVSFQYAIMQLVDLALPRGSGDKVLLVPIMQSAERYDYDDKLKIRELKSHHVDTTLVFYRPNNYVLVGWVNEHVMGLDDNQTIGFETEHDSCWRDGISRIVRRKAQEIEDNFDGDLDGVHVFNSFGLVDSRVIEGTFIHKDRECKLVTFKKLPKQ